MQDSPISSGIGIHNRPGGAILRWRSLHYWCRRRAAYEVALLFEAEPPCVGAARVLPTAGGNAYLTAAPSHRSRWVRSAAFSLPESDK